MTRDELYVFAQREYLVAGEVKTFLGRLGIGLMRKPDGMAPGPPKGLTSKDDRELGDLYDLYMEWYSYFAGEVTDLKIEVATRHEWRQYCLDTLYVERSDIPKGDRALYARVTQGYVEVNAEYVAYQQKLAAVEAELKRMSKHAIQVSRHITLRQDGTNMARRSGNVRGYAPGGTVARTLGPKD